LFCHFQSIILANSAIVVTVWSIYRQNCFCAITFVLVDQSFWILIQKLSSPPVFSRVRVTRSLVLCICFVGRCLSFCTFSFHRCVVCSSSVCGFLLILWNLWTPFNIWQYMYVNIIFFFSFISVFSDRSTIEILCQLLDVSERNSVSFFHCYKSKNFNLDI